MTLKIYNTTALLLLVALGGLMLGLETTSMSLFIGSESFVDFFDYPGPLMQGVIAGSNPFAAFWGCWLAGWVSDRCGRVPCLQVACSLWIIGSLGSVFVLEIWTLIAGRVLKGLAVGIFSATLSLYLLEVTPASMKGLATSTIQWSLTWGIMIMFYLSFLCDFIEDDTSFRLAWAIEGVPGIILLVMTFFFPESPKWIASKGRWKESIDTTDKLSGKKDTNDLNLTSTTPDQQPSDQTVGTPANENAAPDTASLINLANVEGALDRFGGDVKKCSYGDLFRAGLRRHLMVGVFTQAVVQMSGIGVLMFYLVFICEMIGLQGQSRTLCASIQYVVNVVFTVPLILFIEKMRRKDVLVYGATCLALCIGAVGAVMGAYGHEVPPIGGNESVVWEVTGTPGSFALALCFLFVAIFASTLSCVAWLYTNEIFPVRAKAKGSAICMAVSWTVNFLLTFLAPLMLSTMKWGTFVLFGVVGVAGAVAMIMCFPETYGKTDNEIEDIFGVAVDEESKEVFDEKSVKSLRSTQRVHDLAVERAHETTSNIQNHSPTHTISLVRSLAPSLGGSLNNISRLTTVKLTFDEHLKLSPPSQPVSSISTVKAAGLTRSESQAKQMGQSSPFLKKMGAPFDMAQGNQSEPATRPGSGNGGDSGGVQEPPSPFGEAEGYYNVSSGSMAFLDNYDD